MSKGAFFQHFPRRRDYVLALHGLFHEQVFAVLNDQLSTLAPGAERLHSCIILYLDFCLSHGETKSYLFDARADSDLSDAVAAVSVGIIDGVPMVDLPYIEDSRADVDMNVVMTGSGRFVEVQGTAEQMAFSRSELDTMLELAEGGIKELLAAQAAVIATPPAPRDS